MPTLRGITKRENSRLTATLVVPRGHKRNLFDGKVHEISGNVEILDRKLRCQDQTIVIHGMSVTSLEPRREFTCLVDINQPGIDYHHTLAFVRESASFRPVIVPVRAPLEILVGWEGPPGPEIPLFLAIQMIVSRDVA